MTTCPHRAVAFCAILVASAVAQDAAPAMPLARLQPAFVANRGQWAAAARFRLDHGQLRTWIVDDGFWCTAAPTQALGVALRFAFAGAGGAWSGLGNDGSRRHWLLGDRRVTDVPAFAQVRCRELYPGIDLWLRDDGGHCEYDLALAAAADLRAVRVRVTGAERLRLCADGALAIDTAVGELRQPPPRTWCVDGAGRRRDLQGRFVLLAADCYGFAVDGRADGAVTIDPGLIWGGFLGGAGTDRCTCVAVDSQGRAVVAGTTTSTDLPTTPGSYRPTAVAQLDAFAAVVDASGGSLAFCTYLGGSGDETVDDLQVLSGDRVLLAGATTSGNFPVTANRFQAGNAGGSDGFATILASAGNALDYSTYFGGVGEQTDVHARVGVSGDIFLAGRTTGTVPTTGNAYQAARNGLADVFLGVLDRSAAGSTTLRYGTYFGGTGDELAVSHLAVDAFDVATIGFTTASTDCATTATYFQNAHPGPVPSGFIVQLQPGQVPPSAALIYASYFGSNAGTTDSLWVEPDSNGFMTVVARTSAANWPTSIVAAQRLYGGGAHDAIVCRFNPGAVGTSAIMLMTYLGGAGDDSPRGAHFTYNPGVSELVAVGGTTSSPDFPVTATALQPTPAGTGSSGFVAALDMRIPGPGQLVYGTYFDGVNAGDEAVNAIHRASGNVFTIAGETTAAVVPGTPGSFKTFSGGGSEGFVARLDAVAQPPGFTTFGSGCGVPGFVPAITGSAGPRMGQQFTCSVVNLRANGAGLMLMGISNSSWFGIPLPRDLGGLGLPGCNQLTSSDVTFLLFANGTSVSFGFLTPASMAFYGADLYLQYAMVDLAANPTGFALSNGAALDFRF